MDFMAIAVVTIKIYLFFGKYPQLETKIWHKAQCPTFSTHCMNNCLTPIKVVTISKCMNMTELPVRICESSQTMIRVNTRGSFILKSHSNRTDLHCHSPFN